MRIPKWPPFVPADELVNGASVLSGALACVSLYVYLHTLCILSVFFALSLHSVSESCWSPAGFFQPAWSAVYTPGSAIQVEGETVGGGCWVPLLVCRPSCTHAHNPVQTLGPDLSALPRLWAQTHTWQILLLSLSLATLPLCSHCHPSTAHELQSMLGELMVQEEGVGGWLGRGEGERGKGWGSLRRLG